MTTFRSGQLARIKMNKMLWTADPNIWPKADYENERLFEIAHLSPGDIVMYLKVENNHILVLYKGVLGKLSTYSNNKTYIYDFSDILEPIEECLNKKTNNSL
jgi:hypothetical protein